MGREAVGPKRVGFQSIGGAARLGPGQVRVGSQAIELASEGIAESVAVAVARVHSYRADFRSLDPLGRSGRRERRGEVEESDSGDGCDSPGGQRC